MNTLSVTRRVLQFSLFAAALLLCQAPAQASGKKQCVYNQGGYVAKVQWFKAGTLTFTKNGSDSKDAFKVKKTANAFKTEKITLGFKSCVDFHDKGAFAVVSVVGGKIARVSAIIATDIGVVAATGGCIVGAAALTVATAGAGAVAGAACELVADAAVGVICEPDIIPDAKELFGVLAPPTDGKYAVLYGTVFKPSIRIGKP